MLLGDARSCGCNCENGGVSGRGGDSDGGGSVGRGGRGGKNSGKRGGGGYYCGGRGGGSDGSGGGEYVELVVVAMVMDYMWESSHDGIDNDNGGDA